MNTLAKILIIFLIVILITIEACLVSKYWSFITNTDNYDKVGPLIQSMLTPIVAVVTVLVSFIVIDTQFERNRDLEKEKQRLGEVYKRESDAYFNIWKAFSVSYRSLSELQRGTFDKGSQQKIELAFSDAEPYAFVLMDEYEKLFYTFWQKSHELIAKAGKTLDGADKKKLWTDNAKVINDSFYKVRAEFRARYLDLQS